MSNHTATETWNCKNCGRACERPRARGTKPKWCSQRCADLGKKGRRATCAHCGREYLGLGARYCSPRCVGGARRKPPRPKQAPVDRRTPLRIAYETQDWASLLREMKGRTMTNPDGCWIWQGRMSKGYPEVIIGGRYMQAHRVTLEARMGAPLGSQPAHHVCAQTTCVNPDHLIPVTHAENIVEMLSRNAYLARIRELEAALEDVAPSHPALGVLPLA